MGAEEPQTTLDAYAQDAAEATPSGQTKLKCKYCGRLFNSVKSLNLHLTKKHFDEVRSQGHEIVYANEGIEVEGDGFIVTLKLKVRRSLFRDLESAAKALNIPLDELVFKALVSATNWDLFPDIINIITRKPNYVS